MASPSEAAPALVNLIIVINYSGTLERARVFDTRANMDVRAHTHTHTDSGRLEQQAKLDDMRGNFVKTPPSPPDPLSPRPTATSSSANGTVSTCTGSGKMKHICRGPLESRFISSNAACSIVL